jgi:serine acetyltransferase
MVSDPVVSIGDRTLIGQGSYIVGHFSIEIGDDIQTGPYVYITDQNHAYDDPDVPIGRQWPVEASVSIGSGSWLGTGVIVLPGARIGRNVAVGAGSVVVGELPDHCVAVGVPARVIKQYVAGDGWIATNARHNSNTDTSDGAAAAGDDGGVGGDERSRPRSGVVRDAVENSLGEEATFFERPVVPGDR